MALAIAVTTANGCDIFAALGGGEGLACDQDQACPGGLICVDHRCRQPGTCRTDDECAFMTGVCRNGACVAAVDAGASDRAGHDAVHADLERDHTSAPVDGARDAGTGDRAAGDAAIPDSGARDAYAPDAAVPDAGASDGVFIAESGPPNDAGGPAVPCGTVDVFRDDFSSTVFSPIWDSSHVSHNRVLTDLDGDKITFTVTQQTFTSPVWSSIRTWPAASLRNGRMTIEVVASTFAAGEGAWAFFEFVHDSHNLLLFNLHQALLQADISIDGTRSLSHIGTLDLNQHRWWQIRGTDSQVFFETSADGISFTTRHVISAPWFVDRGQVQLRAGDTEDEVRTRDVTISFDNLNLDPGHAAARWCPASSLQEDFSGDLGLEWSINNNSSGSCDFFTSNQLSVSVQPNAEPHCSLGTTTKYLLTNSHVEVRIVQSTTYEQAIAGIILSLDESKIDYGISSNKIVGYWSDGQTPLFSVDRNGETSLRIDYDGSQLVFSAAGTSDWRAVHSRPFSNLDPVTVEIGLRPFSGERDDRTLSASFDDYNFLL